MSPYIGIQIILDTLGGGGGGVRDIVTDATTGKGSANVSHDIFVQKF